MRCPFCKEQRDRVVDTEPSADGSFIRRRRECLACGARYTTYERIERHPLKVIKKDGRRVPFDREKIRIGLEKACEKRPISAETIEAIVSQVENEIYMKFDREVPSRVIGELVIQRLRELDSVAYVRFASVYREFKDVTDFVEEVEPLLAKEGKRS
jgi:transcriptional repressor NrdR